MSRLVCGCSAVVGRINDGKNEEILCECIECQKNGGDFKKSTSWQESARPVNLDYAQLGSLGSLGDLSRCSEHEKPAKFEKLDKHKKRK